MTTTAPAWPAVRTRARAQRRALTVLFTAQVLSGAGLAAGVVNGALLAQDMLGSTSLAGLLGALATAGAALAAAVVGRLSDAYGRRPGLAAGYLAGAVGSAGVVAAAMAGSSALLFAAMVVYGAGTATNLQARYAGADLAAPAYRGRAVSTVLVATTLGGVAGPNLAVPAGDLGVALGVPRLSGLFLVSAAAYGAAALVLAVWLRPDPLLLARELDAAENAAAPPAGAPGADPGAEYGAKPAAGRRGPGVLPGALVMVVTQLVMVAIMTMTPVHMHDNGHGTAASGLVIAVHIGAMYLPAPLSGWLVDRRGPLVVAVAAGVAMLAAGLVAATTAESTAVFAVALALLGVGWSMGLVSGTAMVTSAIPAATRARTQGLVDVAISAAGAGGGLASGAVVAGAGYPLLTVGGGILALAVVPAAVAAAGGISRR
ncbi:MFS transporter [Streptomyces sp. CMB-StM0423]|uniref:MFS transporter n=1 Tax=Streptomyces sp. CMB-StM0423 TaxID=2059884 RepID=UPI000C7073F2|nr:MFS transporter [Streptomyces sp. CMB-StM0423]AUH39434.1 MFS transporter [Streptomyces sp. CMB-StM0423]